MRRTIQTAVAALMSWSAGGLAARAADMSLPPVYQQDESPIVELGGGWYLRADMSAYNMTYNTDVFGSLTNANFGATLGAGYQFNSMFRVDLTYDYMTPFSRNKVYYSAGTGTGQSVAYTLANFGLLPKYGCPVDADSNNPGNVFSVGCSANSWNKVTANVYLMNAYLDLGHWYGVTPYIGAGAGLAYVRTQSSLTYRFVDGTSYGDGNSYCGGSTGLGGISCFHLGYINNIGPHTTDYNFAYALMAGFSYDVTNLLKVDLGYRYLNMGSNVSAQEFRAGIRITPDG